MYLLYVDHSGNPDEALDHFVVGGIALDDGDLRRVQAETDRIVADHLDPHLRGLEIHTQHMRSGKGPWRGIHRDRRDRLLVALHDLLGGIERVARKPARLFATVRTPGWAPKPPPAGSEPSEDVDLVERTFEETFFRFNQFLVRLDGAGHRGPRGLVVADEAKYEQTLQPVTRRWQEHGGRIGTLTRVVEVPLFADSKATRHLQLADVVAHAVYLYYRSAERKWFTPLLPAFDKADGVAHGLVHLTRNRLKCGCPACGPRAKVLRPRR